MAGSILAPFAGLAAGAATEERTQLEALLAATQSCATDSIAWKRAAQGLTRIGVVVPLSGRYERFGHTFVNGLRIASAYRMRPEAGIAKQARAARHSNGSVSS